MPYLRTCRALLLVLAAGLVVTVDAQGPPAGDWRYYGRDAASTKYSPLDEITPTSTSSGTVS